MNKDAGFTLMEVLVTIAIVLVIGSVLVVAANTALNNASFSFKTVNNAAMISRIDRYIREKTNAVYIPYWANPASYIDDLISDLYQSNTGIYIKSVRTIFDSYKIPRGIEVIYIVENYEMRTIAFFSTTGIMEVSP